MARASSTSARRSTSDSATTLLQYAALFLFLRALLIPEVQAQPRPSPAPLSSSPTKAPLAAPVPNVAAEAPSTSPSPSPTLAPSPAAAPAASENSTTGTSVLDPSQVLALEALGLVAGPDVCLTSQPTQIQCDNGSPMRHVTLLRLQYVPPAATLPEAAFANLSTLTSLSFLDCPVAIVPWPPLLAQSLTSFTVSASLGRTADHPELEPLPGWWIGRLHNLQQLTVLDVMLNATSADVILSNMTRLIDLTIQNADLAGPCPETWPATNLTTLDLSNNRLMGALSPNLSTLVQLTHLNLGLNVMSGRIPPSLGDLGSLIKLQLNGNLFSGSLPDSLANLTNLVYLDLSNNRLNGSVPARIGELPALRYLDITNNSFQGPIPFTALFLSQLNTFQAVGNAQLCYDATVFAAKLAGGLPPCDSNGLPVVASAPIAFAPAAPPKAQPGHNVPHKHHSGSNTLVWAAGIGVGVVVFLIVVIVVVSRCCNSGKD